MTTNISKMFSAVSVLAACLLLPAGVNAEERSQKEKGHHWGVYAGPSMSRDIGESVPGSQLKWGAGLFAGVSYEYNFNRYVGINPGFEFDFNTHRYGYDPSYEYIRIKYTQLYSFLIPVAVSFRIPVNDMWGLRIAAGPVIDFDFTRRSVYDDPSWSPLTYTHLNLYYGIHGEIGVEWGRHLGFFARCQALMCRVESYYFYEGEGDGYYNHSYDSSIKFRKLSLSLGVRYNF